VNFLIAFPNALSAKKPSRKKDHMAAGKAPIFIPRAAPTANDGAPSAASAAYETTPVQGGWLSWFFSVPEAEAEAESPAAAAAAGAAAAADADLDPRIRKPMKMKVSKVKQQKENAARAAKAKQEKEERRRFAEEQKELMRQRGSNLLAQQQKKTPMELERIAKRRVPGTAATGPVVVSLGTTSSVERAAVAKALESSMTANQTI